MRLVSRSLGRGRARSGLTLIELLVVMGVLALLTAILLPAVLAARGAARSATCRANLRQLALAAHLYHTSQGCLPMGTPYWVIPNVPEKYPGHSFFLAMSPFFGESKIYDSTNFQTSIYVAANSTCQRASLDALHCPSDPSASEARTLPEAYLDLPSGAFRVAYSSYAACSGLWYQLPKSPRLLDRLPAPDNGIAYANSRVRYADVRDGTAYTLLLGERAHGRLDEEDQANKFWWFDGYHSDTLFWTLYGINPSAEAAGAPGTMRPLVASAGSYHAGGANFAFVDGSVKRVSDRVESWRIEQATGLPFGVTGNSLHGFHLERGSKLGVYQKLSTRAGGESISTEQLHW